MTGPRAGQLVTRPDRRSASSVAACRFCAAAAQSVSLALLDEKWSRRFGGSPAVGLDHGWFRAASGDLVPADHLGTARLFPPTVRAACDFCAHGWIEDVRWRAEPLLIRLAEQRPPVSAVRDDWSALVRWARLTAVLAELLDGMPSASSVPQRDALRRGTPPDPDIACWFFTVQQRLPARVHLSQVCVGRTQTEIVQIVSIDVAHFSALVVLPSDCDGIDVIRRATLRDHLGEAVDGTTPPNTDTTIDLARVQHPHRFAVQRLCRASASSAPRQKAHS